jgi:hypothetical protein
MTETKSAGILARPLFGLTEPIALVPYAEPRRRLPRSWRWRTGTGRHQHLVRERVGKARHVPAHCRTNSDRNSRPSAPGFDLRRAERQAAILQALNELNYLLSREP